MSAPRDKRALPPRPSSWSAPAAWAAPCCSISPAPASGAWSLSITTYAMADLGQLKAERACAALQRFNPTIVARPVAERLTPQNAAALVAAADLVVDSADSFAVTYILSDACHDMGKPLVSASIVGLSGYAGAFCGGGPSYRAVFPEITSDGGTCATIGVLGTAVAVVGGLQAHLALHLLLGLQPGVLGRVFTFDARRPGFGGFDFAGSPEPESFVPFIAPAAVNDDDVVVDLRGLDEAPQSPFVGALRLDVDHVATLSAERSRRIVLCCQSRAGRAGLGDGVIGASFSVANRDK